GQSPDARIVEGVDGTRPDAGLYGDRPVLVHVERDYDMAAHRHRGIRDEPVALHLGDEAPDPGTELDAFGVELDFRAELSATAALVFEGFALRVSLQVAQCVAERSAGGRRSAVGPVLRGRRAVRRHLHRRLRV